VAAQAEVVPQLAERFVDEPAQRLDLRLAVDHGERGGEPAGRVGLCRRHPRVAYDHIGRGNIRWQAARARVAVDDRQPIAVDSKAGLGCAPVRSAQVGAWLGGGISRDLRGIHAPWRAQREAIRASQRSALFLPGARRRVDVRHHCIHVVEPWLVERIGDTSVLVGIPWCNRANQDAHVRIDRADGLHHIVSAGRCQAIAVEHARVPFRGSRPIGCERILAGGVEARADDIGIDVVQAIVAGEPGAVSQLLFECELIAGRW